jgi:phosphate transport system substrate-binding protein
LMFARPRVQSRTKAAVAFFRWSLQRGQNQATAPGFVPLPPEVVSRVEAYWLKRFANGQ